MPSGKKLVGNAVAGEVLTGKTFSNATGNDKVGTMPDRAAMTLIPGASDVAIPAGYHNGAGKVSKVAVDPSKVLSGTVIAGIAGTIPLRGNEEYAGWSRATLGPVPATEARSHMRIPLGAYLNDGANGSGYQAIFLDDPNFTAKNIVAGVSIFGLLGTRTPLTIPVRTGTIASVNDALNVSGLDFRPKMIIVACTAATTFWGLCIDSNAIGVHPYNNVNLVRDNNNYVSSKFSINSDGFSMASYAGISGLQFVYIAVG